MTYKGRVKDGVVVLEGPKAPPDGTEVTVRPVRKSRRQAKKKTFAQRMKKYIGMGSDLPPDFSVNHDHYLYGCPKQKP